MVFLALRAGEVSGALLFFGFAMLLGLTAFALTRRWNTECAIGVDGEKSPPSAPVRFVPQRFLMAALILTAVAILAVVLPLVLR